MNDELKPCPFCGSDVAYVIKHGDIDRIAQRYVYCPDCGASTYLFFNTRDRAIKAWNQRDNFVIADDVFLEITSRYAEELDRVMFKKDDLPYEKGLLRGLMIVINIIIKNIRKVEDNKNGK